MLPMDGWMDFSLSDCVLIQPVLGIVPASFFSGRTSPARLVRYHDYVRDTALADRVLLFDIMCMLFERWNTSIVTCNNPK
jgi:hypothetical protein